MKNFNFMEKLLIAAILFLYLLFLSQDLGIFTVPIPNHYLKYASIILCLFLSFENLREAFFPRDPLIVYTALFFTLLADYHLLLAGNPIRGLISFTIVQLLYLYRTNEERIKLYVNLSAMVALFTVLNFFDPSIILALFYGFLIVMNFIQTFSYDAPLKNRRLMQWAFALFILCDVHVLLFNVLPADFIYFRVASFAMWFFYLPSQLLLALSSKDFIKENPFIKKSPVSGT